MRDYKDFINDFMNNNLDIEIEKYYYSENEKGNAVLVKLYNDYLQVITCQDNGWLRINCYYKDGTITEDYKK